MSRGVLAIIAGPGGAGKDTILRRALELDPNAHIAVSHTTRAPRTFANGQLEENGVHYFFVTREKFEDMIQNGELLENVKFGEVGKEKYYGVSKAQVEDLLVLGHDVLLILEAEGSRTVRRLMPETLFVFVKAPSLDELERRMRARNDKEEQIQFRLAKAREEISNEGWYDQILINNDVESSTHRLLDMIQSHRLEQGKNGEAKFPFGQRKAIVDDHAWEQIQTANQEEGRSLK